MKKLRDRGSMIQNLIIDKSCRINGGVRTFGYSTSANTAIADNQHIRIFNCEIPSIQALTG